jgi:hypothetical protein
LLARKVLNAQMVRFRALASAVETAVATAP